MAGSLIFICCPEVDIDKGNVCLINKNLAILSEQVPENLELLFTLEKDCLVYAQGNKTNFQNDDSYTKWIKQATSIFEIFLEEDYAAPIVFH